MLNPEMEVNKCDDEKYLQLYKDYYNSIFNNKSFDWSVVFLKSNKHENNKEK